MNTKKNYSVIAAGIFLFCAFSACNAIYQITLPGSNPTTSPTTTPPASIPVSTSDKSPVPSATITATPIPTLTFEQKSALAEDLLTNNNNCQLPCWWGFVPGKTDWQTAELYLQTFARRMYAFKRFDNSITHRVAIEVPEHIYHRSLLHTYKEQNGVIQSIDIFPGRSLVYSLPNILTIYGQPEEVWIGWINNQPINNVTSPLRVILFYKNRGFMVQYSPTDLIPTDTTILGCPQKEEYPELFVWSVEAFKNKSFADILGQTEMNGKTLSYLPLEDATGMTLEMFSDLYKNPSYDLCLETRFDLWSKGKKPYK